MPPLTTPATAILFLIAFFVAVMGVPYLVDKADRYLLSLKGK